MSEFGKYIRQILSRKQAVIFPGFGSLVLSDDKEVIKVEGRINPPGPVMLFDPTHPKDDGRLAGEYARGEGLAVEDASQLLLELVDSIKFKLDKGEDFEISQVGKFIRDDDNRIHFVKSSDWIIDPELFGLEALELLELEDEESHEAEVIPKTEEKAPIKEEVSSSYSSEADISPQFRKRPTKKWKTIWIVVGSLAAVLVVVLLLPSNNEADRVEVRRDGLIFHGRKAPKNNQDQESAKTGMDQSAVENAANPGQATDQNGEETPENTTEQQVSPQDQQQVVTREVRSNNNYFIIAGSFQKLLNAEEMMNNLKADGFPAEMIYTDSHYYRVSVRSYATMEEASRGLEKVKTVPGLENAWVWKR